MVLRRHLIVAVGAVSLLTMPLTAIWFLFLGLLLVMASAVVAATRRTPQAQASTLGTGLSIAAGMLVGPAVYLLMALASS